MNITANVREFNDGKGLLAFADVTIGDEFVIKGITIREGQNGAFVSMPSRKLSKPYTDKNGNEKTYEDTFFPITGQSRQNLIDTVLGAYNGTEGTSVEDDDSLPF